MSAPVNYQTVLKNTAINMERLTAEIKTALDKVESCNLLIKVCEVKEKQLTQIAANLTDSVNFSSTEAVNDIGRATKVSFEIEDIASERCKLENERQIALNSMNEALRYMEGQKHIADNLATQQEGEHHWHTLIPVARWKVDIADLKSRRDVVVQNI